jgi:hypothetical protein
MWLACKYTWIILVIVVWEVFLMDELLATFFCHVVELKMSILQHQV